MKKLLLIFSLIFLSFNFSSCSSDDDGGQSITALEGRWLLQNISSGSQLTFENNNFTIVSGSVKIMGTFTLIGNQMNGQVTTRSGSNSGALQPNTFNGNVSIVNNRAEFTNFNGNWIAVFSTWYGKQ